MATIKPTTPLPVITDQVTINGYTQARAHPNAKVVGNDAALKVELDGTSVPFANGLEISNSDGSVIRGLVINGFTTGIAIHGDSVGNRIEGNFIGTDVTGTLDRGNRTNGVIIFGGASENMVGGSTPDKRNVISGNGDIGIVLIDSDANLIKGDYVGTDRTGTKDLGNDDLGVFIGDVRHNGRGYHGSLPQRHKRQQLRRHKRCDLAGDKGARQPHRHHRQWYRRPG